MEGNDAMEGGEQRRRGVRGRGDQGREKSRERRMEDVREEGRGRREGVGRGRRRAR